MDKIIDELQKSGCDMSETMERFLQDENFYLDCLKQALYDEAFDRLKKQLDEKNVTEAFNEAHTLKGLVANMGIKPIYDEIVKIVEPLRAGEINGLEENYDALMDQVERFRKMIQQS